MALTINKNDAFEAGRCSSGYVIKTGNIDFDSSYPTGGESLTAASLGLTNLDFIIFEPRGGYVFTYDHTNALVLAYRASPSGTIAAHTHSITLGLRSGNGGGEVTLNSGSTALVSTAATTLAGGATTNVINATTTFTGTAAALAEVGNAVDLSALTGVRYVAYGR